MKMQKGTAYVCLVGLCLTWILAACSLTGAQDVNPKAVVTSSGTYENFPYPIENLQVKRVSNYGGMPTLGNGIPAVVGYQYMLANTSTTNGSLALANTFSTGIYRVCIYLTISSTTATGGGIQPQVFFNDGVANRTATVAGGISATTTSFLTVSNCVEFYAVSTYYIGWQANDTASGGTATYSVWATLEQLV